MFSASIVVWHYINSTKSVVSSTQSCENPTAKISTASPHTDGKIIQTPKMVSTMPPLFVPTLNRNNPVIPNFIPTPSPTPSLPDLNSQIQPLDFSVIDAEYSSALDKIILVSGSPNQLHVYDPISHKDTTVSLNYPPDSVSVSPDGLFAAVGHDKKISYVDLNKLGIVKILDVSIPVFDLVLDGKGWIYASPKAQDDLRAIEISSNSESKTRVTSLNYNGILRLNPNGQSMYWANSGNTFGNIGRIDISQGVPVINTNLPLQLNYQMCNNLWFSKDGETIITACGNTFKASTDPQNDILYSGRINGIKQIKSAFQISSKNMLVVIDTKSPMDVMNQAISDQLQVYDFGNYQKIGAIGFPKIEKNGNKYREFGQFLFVNRDENQYFVIVKAEGKSGLLHDFGIVNGTIDSLLNALEKPEKNTTQPHTFDGPITSLPNDLVDAEYSDSLDRIVFISDNPSQFHIFDPEKLEDVSIPLAFSPTSISISPDGKSAAIGHDAKISLVDIANRKITKTLEIPILVSDILITNNGWIYALNRSNQQGSVWSVESQSGVVSETKGIGFFDVSTIRLGSDGNSVFGATGSVSPGSFPMFDISQGVPKALKSSYINVAESTSGTCGNLWISEDGLRIFSGCGHVFRITENNTQNMSFNGILDQVSRVSSIDQSNKVDRVIAIPTSLYPGNPNEKALDNSIRVYEYEDLVFNKSIFIPNVVVDGKNVPSHGKFVFFNSSGKKIYAIVLADSQSGYKNVFGLFRSDY